AGLHSDTVARLAGAAVGVQIVPFRGEYYMLRPERRSLVNGLIYPVPDPEFPFLGVHFTRTVHGDVEAGPNAVLALAREGYTWRRVRPAELLATLRFAGFRTMARKYWRTGAYEMYRSLSKRAFVSALQRLVPARRVKQFGVEFYQAGLSAKDIDRLVKFEVLGYITDDMNGDAKAKARKAAASRSRVNWDLLEKRISESENAYQRPIIRRKIDELAAYYRERKDAATLPAIPGAVIITSEKRFTFTPVAGHHDQGLLHVPAAHGVLRVLDGQHRLLALHSL